MNVNLANNDTQLKIRSYTLNVGFRTVGVDNRRDIVPYHEIGLESVPDDAGRQVFITVGFWTSFESFSPTELGSYDVQARTISMKAPMSEFGHVSDILRGQTPVFFIFNQANVVGGRPNIKSVTSASIVTGSDSAQWETARVGG